MSACEDLEARLLLTLQIAWSAVVSTDTITHSITINSSILRVYCKCLRTYVLVCVQRSLLYNTLYIADTGSLEHSQDLLVIHVLLNRTELQSLLAPRFFLRGRFFGTDERLLSSFTSAFLSTGLTSLNYTSPTVNVNASKLELCVVLLSNLRRQSQRQTPVAPLLAS